MDSCKSCNTKFTEAELHYRDFDPSFNFYNFLFKSHCTKCIEQCKIKFTVEDMDKFNPKLFDTVKDDPEKMKYYKYLDNDVMNDRIYDIIRNDPEMRKRI